MGGKAESGDLRYIVNGSKKVFKYCSRCGKVMTKKMKGEKENDTIR